jgi:hypothetical protein
VTRPDAEESRLWAEGMEQPVPAMVARAVGLDRLNMDRAKFAEWVSAMVSALDAADRIGEDGMDQSLQRVEGYADKRRRMADHLQAGRSWLAIEECEKIPWHEQVRIISHNRPTYLWTWDEGRRMDFELDVRDGKNISFLCRKHGPLSPHICRSLVNMMRGNIRAS